jgi:hypothetical protein
MTIAAALARYGVTEDAAGIVDAAENIGAAFSQAEGCSCVLAAIAGSFH